MKKMSRWETIKTLRRHTKLSEERNVAFAQNKVAKVFGYVMFAFCILYLMFLSIPLAMAANSSRQHSASSACAARGARASGSACS